MGVTGNVHSVETFGTVDGPGIRYVLFLQGCPLRCKFCHNPDTWERGKGIQMDSEQVITDIGQYRQFYHSSGGGVTASGGEPTLQPEFVEAVFQGVKRLGLNTALDTSGFVEISRVEGLLNLTDLVLLDIKETGQEEHIQLTGVDIKPVKNFAYELERRKTPVWVRHVVIPGVTGNMEKIRRLGEFLKEFTVIERIELLGYHKMGSHKWELKGCKDPYLDIPAASTEQMEEAKELLRQLGLKNIV